MARIVSVLHWRLPLKTLGRKGVPLAVSQVQRPLEVTRTETTAQQVRNHLRWSRRQGCCGLPEAKENTWAGQ